MRLLRKIGSLLAFMILGSPALGLERIELEGLGWLGTRQMEERLGFLLGEQRRRGVCVGSISFGGLCLSFAGTDGATGLSEANNPG